MNSLPKTYRAVVAGSTGGIGAAFLEALQGDPHCAEAVGLSRSTEPAIDLENEQSIAAAADIIGRPIHLFIDATGILSNDAMKPERALREIEPASFARAFAINATGPALLLKHFVPLMPRRERIMFATLSARVGSISDNTLGGWYAYRASKAALNMIVRCAAIELARINPQAVCVGLHPGTVATQLSDPFAGNRDRFQPSESVARLLRVLDGLEAADSGGLFAYDGERIDW